MSFAGSQDAGPRARRAGDALEARLPNSRRARPRRAAQGWLHPDNARKPANVVFPQIAASLQRFYTWL